MKKLLLFFVFMAGFGTASAQLDTIYTHEANIPCKVTEITDSSVKFCYPGGVEIAYHVPKSVYSRW